MTAIVLDDAPMDLAGTLTRAAAGDRAAQDQLVEQYYATVQGMVHRGLEFDFRRNHRWILPMFSTGDIVQEVFRSVLTELATFDDHREDAFLRFTATLVKNRLIDAVRFHEAGRRDQRRSHEAPTEGVEAIAIATGDPTPSMAAALAEQMVTFRQVMASFPIRDRAVLELRLEKELAFRDIAEQLAYPSEDAARKAFASARARLLVRLQGRGINAAGDAP